MIRWLLAVGFFVMWTNAFDREQLSRKGSGLAISRSSFLPRSPVGKPTVHVRVLNFEDRILKDAVVWKGTKVTIICKVHGFSKGFRLSWTEPSGKTTLPTEYELKIRQVFNRVTHSNSGRYFCNASNTEKGIYLSKSVFLNVTATPTIRTNNAIAVEGKRAVLRCTATEKARTQCRSISWLFKGKELQSDANTKISGHTKLIFHRVNRRHSGTYECRLTIGQIQISAYPQLTVCYPPEILEGPDNVITRIGDDVTFCCNVAGYPRPAVTWQLYGMAINALNASATQSKYSQSSEKGIHLLTITDVQQEDGGRYRCYVGNDNGVPLFVTAYLHVQGPPSPPRVQVETIYEKGTAVFAALHWTEPDHDSNNPIISYEPGCKRKSRDRFHAAQVDSGVFSTEILCTFINRSNPTLPYLIHLLLRVTVNNIVGSTSSELLDLTVGVCAAKNNQSEFEVFMLPPPPSPPSTMTTTTSTNQAYSSTRSRKIFEGQHTASRFSTSDEASGDSDVSTTEWWPLFTKSVPTMTIKPFYTSFHRTKQFLSIADSKKRNFEDESDGDSELTSFLIGSGSLGAALFILLAVVGATYVRKRHGVEQNLAPWQRLESPTTCTEQLFESPYIHLESPRVCSEESLEPPATMPCMRLQCPTTTSNEESVQEPDQLSEGLNGAAHHDQGSRPTISVENTTHPFSTSFVKATVGSEGGDFYSGRFLLSVPEEAVQTEQQIGYQFLFGTEPTDILKDWFVFGPILVLEPHGFHFQVPVMVRFLFTATLEGWMLVLIREEPEKGWKTVLTLDTDTDQVIQQDSHCNYDVKTRLLLLKHFCKYRWCGFRKRTASRSEKMLACSLFARMDPSGNSCNFTLYLTDNCYEILEEVGKEERRSSEVNFVFKNLKSIIVGDDGDLTIELTPIGFEIEQREKSVTIAIRDLWRTYGVHKRIVFDGKCFGRTCTSTLKDPQLHIKLATSEHCEEVRAVFKIGENSVLRRSQSFQSFSSVLQQSQSSMSLAAQGEQDDMTEIALLNGSYGTQCEMLSSVDKLRFSQPDSARHRRVERNSGSWQLSPNSCTSETAEQLSDRLNLSSHLDQGSRPALLPLGLSVENTARSVSFQATEKSLERSTGAFHLDQGTYPSILVENTVHPFSTSPVITNVGPEGGDFHSGSFLVSVPKGAVLRKQAIKYQFLFGTEPTPAIHISEDWFVFSPILVLEPHDCPFQVPVSVRLPFSATLEGWVLVLLREQSEEGWETVLTLNTDTRQVTQEDPHCNYDVNQRLLLLNHFCKYLWCGYKTSNSSRSEKVLACLLLARMDSSGNSCNFALHLTDNCACVFQEVKEIENEKSEESFGLKDLVRIAVGTEGELTIQFTSNGFDLKENSVKVAIKDLWKKYGCQKRVLFRGKCVGRIDGSQDLELHVNLSTSDQSENMLAIFKTGESSVLQESRSYTSLAAQGQGPRTISSSRGSLCSENSPVFDERNPPATFESNPDFSPPNVPGSVSPASKDRMGTKVLRQHWKELNDNLDPELVLDELFQMEVINRQELEEIRGGQGTPRRVKANTLLSKMLARSDTAVRQFAEIMSRTRSEEHKDLGERLLQHLEIDDTT